MAQPTEYVESLSRFGTRLGLERISALLGRLGDPHVRVPAVHIAGTNGKGSTAALVSAVLCKAGYRVGLTTSPHLISFRERIAVGGGGALSPRSGNGREADSGADWRTEQLPRPVDPAVWDGLVERVRRAADVVAAGPFGPPTQFEVTTAMAFLHFAEIGTDINVVEVGLGGRFDATNVLTPEVCAITPVGRDHVDRLGTDLAAIASEKAGILKAGRPAVVAPQQPEAMRVLREAADRVGAPLVSVADTVKVTPSARDLEGSRVMLRSLKENVADLQIGLAGPHQLVNAATAYAVVSALRSRGWEVTEGAVRDGFRFVKWPARLQVLQAGPLVVLDGAHNLEGVRALGVSLEQLLPPGSMPVFVIGLQGEKPVDQFLRDVRVAPAAVVCTKSRSGRTSGMDPGKLADAVRRTVPRVDVVPDARDAVARAVDLAGAGGVVCIWGSLYLAGEVLDRWAGDVQ